MQFIKLLLVFFALFLFSYHCSAQKKSAILVIDIQHYYTHNLLSNSEADLLVQNINSFQKDTKPDHYIYIKTVAHQLLLSKKGIKIDTLRGLYLDNRLNIIEKNIYWKNEPSAFHNIDLFKFLIDNEVEKLYLVGLLGEKCVFATAKMAKNMGFDVVIIPNCMAFKNNRKKDRVLSKYKDLQIEIQ